MDSYKAGLACDESSVECRQGLDRTMRTINQLSQGEVDKERAARGMQDPEIQGILQDPVMRQVLQDMQQDPRSARKHLQNPEVASKIEKLVAAGVLQMR